MGMMERMGWDWGPVYISIRPSVVSVLSYLLVPLLRQGLVEMAAEASGSASAFAAGSVAGDMRRTKEVIRELAGRRIEVTEEWEKGQDRVKHIFKKQTRELDQKLEDDLGELDDRGYEFGKMLGI